MQSTSGQAIVCNLEAIPAAERVLHGQRWQQLLAQKLGEEPYEEGYVLIFPVNHATLSLLMQVIANERLCCPFIDFTLELPAGQETLRLRMTGPSGTQQLLANELGLQQ